MSGPQQSQSSIEEIAHAFDEDAKPVDLSSFAVEDWVTQALFWMMVICVFLQFFTRYVLNNSLAWTEEIAINLLIAIVFLGAVMCVRVNRHIHVDVIYHYLPARVGRVLAILVDVIRIVFFAYMVWLMWRYAWRVGDERMSNVDLPRWPLFYGLVVAFALMFVRALQVAYANLKRGYSVLERPEEFLGGDD